MGSSVFIALLRGINVGGRNKVSMAELRSLCTDLGCHGVRSYIQSGNLVFRAGASPAELEPELERALGRRFGLDIRVIVRTASTWSVYVEGNPFPEVSRSEPSRVMLALSKGTPEPCALQRLREHAGKGERVAQTDDALWIHYADGVGRSSLSPALLDRLVGSPVTARNWRTVLRLGELACESAGAGR